ncbi:Uncharacterised protein (plasmid) [Legionella adelaidensis]|uniref:Uncharacterized protein n=1 Tax=Legionella adelaidensis TaxID=45056 RepID=A0A0W0R5S0_9GAMM|nr:hypothetical protein [Legionella adelaidensis]KTC66419.1 hypothetical protein Lade_1077 [Legionella adelaidensis]VEH85017.1 Uncharacterised protein [Legionella adelaidensis]
MAFPKISAVLNNCILHSTTPEIIEQIYQIAESPEYDNGFKAGYNHLKNCFAEFYEFDPSHFEWDFFRKILQRYNPHEVQIIFGPVLRLFMKKYIAENPDTPYLSENIEEYIALHTEINRGSGRYYSASPFELYWYVCNPLGISLSYVRDRQKITMATDNAYAEITLFHKGGIEGAHQGGHWERVENQEDSEDYAKAPSTQLSAIELLLGNDARINEYGFQLLKKHVRTSAKAITGHFPREEYNEIILSALQINKYAFAINLVNNNLALKILGPSITAITRQFLLNFNSDLPKDNFLQAYLRALGENILQPHLVNPTELPTFPEDAKQYYQDLAAQLTKPIQLPIISCSDHDSPSYRGSANVILDVGIRLGKIIGGLALVCLCIALFKISLLFGLALSAGCLGFYSLFNGRNKSKSEEAALSLELTPQ